MRAARQERFDFLCGYRGSNAYQAYCDRGSGKLQLSAVSQHNPGFMCAKRGQVMMSGRGTDSNTNWKQTKCGEGFYCSKGPSLRLLRISYQDHRMLCFPS